MTSPPGLHLVSLMTKRVCYCCKSFFQPREAEGSYPAGPIYWSDIKRRRSFISPLPASGVNVGRPAFSTDSTHTHTEKKKQNPIRRSAAPALLTCLSILCTCQKQNNNRQLCVFSVAVPNRRGKHVCVQSWQAGGLMLTVCLGSDLFMWSDTFFFCTPLWYSLDLYLLLSAGVFLPLRWTADVIVCLYLCVCVHLCICCQC